jgi:hypothetical protein
MFGSSCAILMRALLRLSLHVEIFIIGSTRLFLRNLVNYFARFESIVSTYVPVVLLLILIMNMLNNCYMLLMILCGV